ncbi:MAG: IS21 family transposase [Alphaproteobacteria bacterium]|nr:IS21 family transposase [Alphaproteobacteria bacterium]
MILDLHRQGMSLSAISRRTGMDRKTIRKYVQQGLEPPAYKSRTPKGSVVDPYRAYLAERVAQWPELTARRLLREIRDLGYGGGYTTVKEAVSALRPAAATAFERRFETPPGKQAQVDFAHFRATFADEPGTERVVWLFSLVLGHSRLMWARFVPHQDLQAVLRCLGAAFEAIGGVPAEVLFDRMKTAVQDEGDEGTLADLVTALAKAEREGVLRERLRFLCRPALLIVDEIGYLPVVPGGGNLFFQLVNARYERGAMILTSNRGFGEWGEVFGDAVVATALLDRLLHHAVVVQIEGASYRMRKHAGLVSENALTRPSAGPGATPLQRRGRPPKNRTPDHAPG